MPTGTKRAEDVWGTVVSIDVRNAGCEAAVAACFAWFRRVDDLFSTWRPDSEVMRIAAKTLAPAAASAEVRVVLDLSDELGRESGGAFDVRFGASAPRVGQPGFSTIDPSGIVKGWALERAAEIIEDAGGSDFFINAGGDVLARGAPLASAEGWRVGIQHPWERDRVAASLLIAGGAVATSGRYERGDHVIDPRTGLAATELASVTVVGPDLAVADVYATAVMVMGAREGLSWIGTRVGYEAMAITDAAEVISTPGFERFRIS